MDEYPVKPTIDHQNPDHRLRKLRAANRNCEMKTLMLMLMLAMLAVPGQAQDKDAAIERTRLYIGTSAKFMGEFPTVDGRQTHWVFSWGKLQGIPVVIDVPAFPTKPEIDIAESAAVTEARSIYTWMSGSKTSEP